MRKIDQLMARKRELLKNIQIANDEIEKIDFTIGVLRDGPSPAAITVRFTIGGSCRDLKERIIELIAASGKGLRYDQIVSGLWQPTYPTNRTRFRVAVRNALCDMSGPKGDGRLVRNGKGQASVIALPTETV
jgi:hypothetical protein